MLNRFLLLFLISAYVHGAEYLPDYQKRSCASSHFCAAGKECKALAKRVFHRTQENTNRDPNKSAVLLVHGLNASPSSWCFVMEDLNAQGFEVYTLSLSYWPQNGYKKSVNQIYEKIQTILQTHESVAVVGHSLGGVASLDAVNHLGEEKKRVSKLVTVNSPLNGTTMINSFTKLLLPNHLVEVLTYRCPFVEALQEEGLKTQMMGVKMYHTATESDHLVTGLDTCFLPNFEEGVVVRGTGHLSTLSEPTIRSKLLEWLSSANTSTLP